MFKWKEKNWYGICGIDLIGIGGMCNLYGIYGIVLIGIGGLCFGLLDVRYEVNFMG